MEAKKLEKLREMRKYERYLMKVNLSSNLCSKAENKQIGCISTDVSKMGLGIVTFQNISSISEYYLTFPSQEKKIEMELMWCRADQVKKEIFHAGLNVKNQNENLLEFFIKEKMLTQKILAPDYVKGEAHVDYYDLRETVSGLHISDRDLVRKVGFEKLYDSHTAYQCRYKNESIVVVIDRGTKPADLKSLSAFDASQIMFVVKEKSQGLSKKWVKVWPSSDLLEEKIQSDEIAAAEKLKQETPELKKVNPVAEIDDDEDIELEVDE